MILLILIAIITTVASKNISLHDNPEVTIYRYKRPQLILSSIHQNPFLSLPDPPSIITEGKEMIYIRSPPPLETYVWQYTGFFEAKWTGDHIFTIGETKLGTIQLGTKTTQSQEFDDLITDEKHFFSRSPAHFSLVKGEFYAIKIVFISGNFRVPVYLLRDGIKKEINEEIKQALYNDLITTPSVVPRKTVLYFTAGFDYFLFLLPPGLNEEIVLEHYRVLTLVSEGSLDQEFDGISLEYFQANYTTEIFGHISPPSDGEFIISMGENLIASLQFYSVGFQENEKFYSIDEDWNVLDTRSISTEKFELKHGLLYPFRLVIIGEIYKTNWEISAFDPEYVEVNLFGLWENPYYYQPQPESSKLPSKHMIAGYSTADPEFGNSGKNDYQNFRNQLKYGLQTNEENKTLALISTSETLVTGSETAGLPSISTMNSDIWGHDTSLVEKDSELSISTLSLDWEPLVTSTITNIEAVHNYDHRMFASLTNVSLRNKTASSGKSKQHLDQGKSFGLAPYVYDFGSESSNMSTNYSAPNQNMGKKIVSNPQKKFLSLHGIHDLKANSELFLKGFRELSLEDPGKPPSFEGRGELKQESQTARVLSKNEKNQSVSFHRGEVYRKQTEKKLEEVSPKFGSRKSDYLQFGGTKSLKENYVKVYPQKRRSQEGHDKSIPGTFFGNAEYIPRLKSLSMKEEKDTHMATVGLSHSKDATNKVVLTTTEVDSSTWNHNKSLHGRRVAFYKNKNIDLGQNNEELTGDLKGTLSPSAWKTTISENMGHGTKSIFPSLFILGTLLIVVFLTVLT